MYGRRIEEDYCMEEQVILVNEADVEVGTMGKMEAHQLGILHRALSVFIFNNKGELLLQQRAANKYHSPGEWTNTCCSHPRPSETTKDAAIRRLQEEMGITSDLTFAFDFTYQTPFSNRLIEHEFDHVFVGQSDDLPVINPLEVADYRYIKLTDLKEDLIKNPQRYTVWLKICFDKLVEFKNSMNVYG